MENIINNLEFEVEYPEENIPWYFCPELYSSDPSIVRLMVDKYKQEEEENDM